MRKHHANTETIFLIVAAVVLTILSLVLMVTWPSHYETPYHATVTDFTVATMTPPGTDPEAQWYRYYQTDFMLQNDSTHPIELDPYLFDYRAADSSLHPQYLEDPHTSALLRSRPALPCGTTIPVSHQLRISTHGKNDKIFPFQLYFGNYDAQMLVAQADSVTK